VTSNIYVRLSGDFSGDDFVFVATNKTTNPIRICVATSLLANTSYRLDSEIQYTADSYVTETHYIENMSITNSTIPVNVSLYSLLVTRSQEFLITFKDNNFIPVEGALIELTRQYLNLGQFLTVEIMKTDTDGRTVGHFVLNDEIYTLYVKKNGVLLATFENVKAFCSNIATGDCRINLNQASSSTRFEDFENAQNVSFTQSYNDTSKDYRVTFVTTDNSIKEVNLTILKYDNFLNQTVCSTATSGTSGSLNCTIPTAYYNNTLISKIYVEDVEVSTNIFFATINNNAILTSSRYLLGFFLIVTLPLIAISSPVISLTFFILGIIGASTFYLIDFGGFVGGFSVFLWIIVASLILIFKITRPKEEI